MAAATNPLNTANATLHYSSNSGGAYTAFGTEVINVEPNGRMRKIIERKLLGVTRVQKFPARRNFGKIKITLEYSSATWAIWSGFDDSKTLIWIKSTQDDTGGTNGSLHVFKGYISELDSPKTPGDDEVESFSFTIDVDDFAFTAGA